MDKNSVAAREKTYNASGESEIKHYLTPFLLPMGREN
jgi:hypothetical protein